MGRRRGDRRGYALRPPPARSSAAHGGAGCTRARHGLVSPERPLGPAASAAHVFIAVGAVSLSLPDGTFARPRLRERGGAVAGPQDRQARLARYLVARPGDV